MSGPLRLRFSGALYHVTSRGDRREAVHEDGIPDEQRRPPAPPRADFVGREIGGAAMAAVDTTGNNSRQRIAEAMGVHFTLLARVARA